MAKNKKDKILGWTNAFSEEKLNINFETLWDKSLLNELAHYTPKKLPEPALTRKVLIEKIDKSAGAWFVNTLETFELDSQKMFRDYILAQALALMAVPPVVLKVEEENYLPKTYLPKR